LAWGIYYSWQLTADIRLQTIDCQLSINYNTNKGKIKNPDKLNIRIDQKSGKLTLNKKNFQPS
jgi:hypothetical protein